MKQTGYIFSDSQGKISRRSPGFLRDSGTFGKAKNLEFTNIKNVREEKVFRIKWVREDAERLEETGDKST